MEFVSTIFAGEPIGYFATFLFAISYLVTKEVQLLWVQAFAALVWIAYGLGHGTMPVVLANVIVAISATQKAARLTLAGRRARLN